MSKSENKFDSDIYINDRNAPRGATWQVYILKGEPTFKIYNIIISDYLSHIHVRNSKDKNKL